MYPNRKVCGAALPQQFVFVFAVSHRAAGAHKSRGADRIEAVSAGTFDGTRLLLLLLRQGCRDAARRLMTDER